MVVTLFVGHLLALQVALLVSVLFIVCMLMLSLAFSAFLGEVLVCTRTMQGALQHPDSFHAQQDSSISATGLQAENAT